MYVRVFCNGNNVHYFSREHVDNCLYIVIKLFVNDNSPLCPGYLLLRHQLFMHSRVTPLFVRTLFKHILFRYKVHRKGLYAAYSATLPFPKGERRSTETRKHTSSMHVIFSININ